MDIPVQEISNLQKEFLLLEEKRWRHKKNDRPREYSELSCHLAGIFYATEKLGIDLGIRRAGPYFKKK